MMCWLFGKEINLMGMRLGTLLGELGIKREIVARHDFSGYSASIKLGGRDRADGGGLQGARHRACGDADGLFRAIRPRCPGLRHGDGLPQ
jgi:hypothetical protein